MKNQLTTPLGARGKMGARSASDLAPLGSPGRKCLAVVGAALLGACGPATLEDDPTEPVEGAATADPSLKGRWRFQETSGTQVADSSGNGNTGILKNGAVLAPGTSNNAVKLDGVNDYVEVRPSSSLDITNAITVSLWVNVQNTGAHQIFIDKPASATSHIAPYFAYSIYGLFVSSTTVRPCFFITAGGSTSVAKSSANISTGWHHLAGTYDGSAVKIYVDGILRGTTAKTGRIATYATPLRFGLDGGHGQPTKGLLDDIRVYNRSLPACEVSGLVTGAACSSSPDAGVTMVDAGSAPADAGTRQDAGTQSPSGTTLLADGFESGTISAWACSGNCPAVATSPVADGRYSGKFELTRSMPTPYRTEVVPVRNNELVFGKEHWITMKYRFEDWAQDAAADMSPFQVHMRPWDWSKPECTQSVGSAWSNAPFYMATANDRSMFNTYKGRTLWEGPVVKGQWIDLRIHFKISAGSDGFVEAWMNGNYMGKVTGPNTVALDDCGQPFRAPYFKMGIYKWPWREGRPATDSSRRLLYIDSVGIVRKD